MLYINSERLLQELDELSQIGRTPDGGVSRPALSPADVEGRAWFRRKVEGTGLQFRQDGAGNLSAVLPAANPAARTVIAGSHLDSVPNGGRFDGSLGVLTALEAVRTIKEAGLDLPCHLEAISFTDEEGAHIGLMGSRAFTGILKADDLEHPRGGSQRLNEGLERVGLTKESVLAARRDPTSLAGFVEVHIEQGTRLERAGIDIGVVTSIVGIRSYTVTFLGEAAHAGTMPMADRADSLWGAAAFVLRARETVMERFTPGVMNCGHVRVEPGAFNIVPARAELSLELRHGSDDLLDQMEQTVHTIAQEAAHAYGLDLEWALLDRVRPAPMHEGVIAALEQAADTLHISHTRLISFAGHDSQSMSTVTPTGLFFIPCRDGISHNPKEYARPEDVVNAGNVMLHTLLRLAGTQPELPD